MEMTLQALRRAEHSMAVKRNRRKLERLAKAKFITTEERKARVAAKAKLLGLKTRQQIAEACGMHRPSFERMLNNKNPSLEAISRVALGLGVSISYLTEK